MTSNPSVLELTRMEELARAATPGRREAVGPYHRDGDVHPGYRIEGDKNLIGYVYDSDGNGENDAEFFEACSPEVILALVRVARAAQAYLAAVYDEDSIASAEAWGEIQHSLEALK